MLPIFRIRANEKEKLFFSQWRKGKVFMTVLGRKNKIVDINPQTIVIQSEKQDEAKVIISREKLRRCMEWIFYRRTATRKDLEPFCKFTSALMGLLLRMFDDIAMIQRTVRGAIRITLKDLRFFFSGVCRSPEDIKRIRENGGNFVMMSYFNLLKDTQRNFIRYLRENEMRLFLDSGAFSLFQAQFIRMNTDDTSPQELYHPNLDFKQFMRPLRTGTAFILTILCLLQGNIRVKTKPKFLMPRFQFSKVIFFGKTLHSMLPIRGFIGSGKKP